MSRVVKIILLVIGGVILAALIALLLGFVVMLLWNWLMPEIFGLPEITFWQAWGLFLLSKILLGSHEHHHKTKHHNHDNGKKWKEKFKNWCHEVDRKDEGLAHENNHE